MTTFKTKRKGFTLIEIIIAIVIFSIGMIAILQAIVFFVRGGTQVQQRAVATLLAKEAVDIVYNQRDTNISRSVRRDCAKIDITKADACGLVFEINALYRIQFDGENTYSIDRVADSSEEANKLYIKNNNGIQYFTHTKTDTPSNYARYIQFTEAEVGGQKLPKDKALKMNVFVQYIPGFPNRTVVLETIISAGERNN